MVTAHQTQKFTIRLAEHLDENQHLTTDGIRKLTNVLEEIATLTRSLQTPVKAVATFAMRMAKNHPEVSELIFKKTGIKIDVITGEEEARLTYIGIRSSLKDKNKKLLCVDIGGGSTEFIAADGKTITHLSSLSLGAVTISKEFFDSYQYSKSGYESIIKRIKRELENLKGNFSDFDLAIASSGTAKAIAKIDYFLKNKKESANEDGYVLTTERIKFIHNELCKLKSSNAIYSNFPIEQKRAEIIIVGSRILFDIAEHLSVKQWTITTHALREGVLIDWANSWSKE